MFERLINELQNLKQTKVSVPIEPDENGYLDKECPDDDCMFQFKVFEDDWADLCKDEAIYCPMCGKDSTSDTFWTTEQIENAKEQAVAQIEGRIHKALKAGANDFNRKQPKSGFLTMSMKVTGHTPLKLIIPIPSREVFEQRIKCEKCDTRYSVIGSAFFCPCCGHNSVEKTFDNTIKKIEDSISSIPEIRIALEQINKDQAENTCQTLIEKGLLDCVVAFQRYCDKFYEKHYKTDKKIPMNAFQKLDVGGDLWMNAFGESYSDWLSESELIRLGILFQRRHLLQHTEGIVDDRYVQKSGDNKYKIGERIIVKEKDVIELLSYVKVLVDSIKKKAKD